MLVQNNNGTTIDVVSTKNNLTYVKDGMIYSNISAPSILVESETDLDILGNYPPGSIAYTVGFANMWQKGTDGNWEEIT